MFFGREVFWSVFGVFCDLVSYISVGVGGGWGRVVRRV